MRYSRFGFTDHDYEKLFARQGGKCPVCGKHETNTPKRMGLHVDHCHRTGQIRGLLCGQCNRGIGMLQDSVELLMRAAQYISDFEDFGRRAKPARVVVVKKSDRKFYAMRWRDSKTGKERLWSTRETTRAGAERVAKRCELRLNAALGNAVVRFDALSDVVDNERDEACLESQSV